MHVYLCIIGGHTASQVADSVSILNKVCLYRDKRNEAVYDSTKSLYMLYAVGRCSPNTEAIQRNSEDGSGLI